MISTSFETRIKIQQIIQNQLPEFILDESPKTSDFLKQYYISQEHTGGPVDITDNLDQYLKLDNLTPEVVIGFTTTTNSTTISAATINVASTKGFPEKYGLIKIDDEIITYTGITTNSFTGCIRGFSGVTNLYQDVNKEELIFESTEKSTHNTNSKVTNLSILFLQEFYKKIKYSLTPGLEDTNFVSNLNVGNFIKEAKSFYRSKGTIESFKILFNVLFGVTPKVINLEQYLIKSSSASYVRRQIALSERLSGEPTNLIGQTIKKQGDEKTTATISEVEIITRRNKTYYKLLIFVGYDDATSYITGNFTITPSTKVLELIQPGSTIISVDSTIGFSNSGSIFYKNQSTGQEHEIFYTSKSVNQFFGCSTSGNSSIGISIPTQSIVRTSEIYFGYENGDTSKKVELRITGVVKDLTISNKFQYDFIPGDEIYINYLGEVIKKSDEPTYKEILSNSWIYNTRSSYQIDTFDSSGNTLVTKSDIEDVSLKKGDTVEILIRNSQNIVNGYQNVGIVDIVGKEITLDTSCVGLGTTALEYDLRRKLKKSSSTFIPLEFSPNVLSDVQNVYSDTSEDDSFIDNLYVAANSLPSYAIETKTFKYNPVSLSGFDPDEGKSSAIDFANEVSFISGHRVYYQCSGNPIIGLTSETSYFVEVLSNKKSIKLYSSLSFVGTSDVVFLGDEQKIIPPGTHQFILYDQKEDLISPQSIFRKIRVNPDIGSNDKISTIPGPVGILKDGVEIFNYKTNDKVYYGPLDSVTVLNGGENFDVLNPPKLDLSYGEAKLQPVLSGSIEKVYVDRQDFDIDVSISIGYSGGNGSGAVFKPVIKTFTREVLFDGRNFTDGGGLNTDSETITFESDHGFVDGQPIIYDNNLNLSIGIGSFDGSNFIQYKTLLNNEIYYPKVLNIRTIKLHNSSIDVFTGINTIGFTTENATGIHKFKTLPKKTLSEIKVIEPGSGFQNRKLIVKPNQILPTDFSINFKNHGFLDGDLINYNYEPNLTTGISTLVTGLSTSKQYYVLKTNNDSFRICDAGIGGTDKTNYNKRKYVQFTGVSTAAGYQIFSYPELSLSVNFSSIGIGTTLPVKGSITATPVVRGKITDVYLYENGSNYGSSIINVNNNPKIIVRNGKFAQLSPIIVNSQIIDVQVQYGGQEYFSVPDIIVNGSGSGCTLRAIVQNEKISSVIVVNPGFGYSTTDTSILVKSAGQNAKFDSRIRELTVNSSYEYGIQDTLYRSPASDIVLSSKSNLQYYVVGYNQYLINYFNDNGVNHSPIIGWSYDGNPIYGPYGHDDPSNLNSSVRLMIPGYSYSATNVENRPVGFSSGFFIEDYRYTENGDLDEYNGRYCKTPEFPKGVYAYFATVEQNPSGQYVGRFPYFIGNHYRSYYNPEETLLDQSFDFNASNLIRNTHPYKIGDNYAGNDFIIESNEIVNQKTIIESVFSGNVDGFDIVSSGNNYKVGDQLLFSTSKSEDLVVEITEVEGETITSIATTSVTYENAKLTWENGNSVKVTITPNHNFINEDKITISGVSTSLSKISGTYRIGLTTYTSILSEDIGTYASTGIHTDISVSNIPSNISIGSSIKIESEILTVLNIFSSFIRVKRYSGIATSHTSPTPIYFIPDSFTIPKKVQRFSSTLNDVVYFNPILSVGVGTTPGTTISKSYNIGDTQYTVSIPTQSIYLPDHPFKTGDRVTFSRPASTSDITYSPSITGTPSFQFFSVSNTPSVYIINKSKDLIGISTDIAGISSGGGVYFLSNGSANYEYSFTSQYSQETALINQFKTTVSTANSSKLKDGDIVTLNVKPNIKTSSLPVGFGTTSVTTSTIIRYNSTKGLLLVNPLGFSTLGISTENDTITLPNHNLKSGDKVHYTGNGNAPVGLLDDNVYFIKKINNNVVSLCESYNDSVSTNGEVINTQSLGGNTQEISLINPEIKVTKNTDLVFDLSHVSLVGFDFNIFHNENFSKKFVSVAKTDNFIVSGVGTIGVSTFASLTVRYSDDLPERLYYNLEKSGYISTSDKDVIDANQIKFVDSEYSGSYAVYGVGTTTFAITIKNYPESLTYNQSQCDTLVYSTKSVSAIGGISKIKISSTATYKELPRFVGNKKTDGGVGAYIVAKSNSIGKVNELRIINSGFDYASDVTLRPTALFPQVVSIESSNTITNIDVEFGGTNYITPPEVVIIDTDSRDVINSGDLRSKLRGSTVESVQILSKPTGLPAIPVTLRTVNNSNGVSISLVESSSSGIVTCILSTPLAGFGTDPFASGDLIWVEGIQKSGVDGTGFNSSDYGYNFFTVANYYPTNPGKLEFNVSGVTTNPGIAKTVQDAYASIIKYDNYPRFSVLQKHLDFFVGEKIYVNSGFGFESTDLVVSASSTNFIRLIGRTIVKVGDIIKGFESNSIASINTVKKTTGTFSVGASKEERIGWSDETGKLSEDSQVLSDNDYYQNLSYSVKSPKEWNQIVTPVNRLVHSVGLKNFADTELLKSVQFNGIGYTGAAPESETLIINDFIDERRVDTINNFELVSDTDVDVQSTPLRSKFIKFDNLNLSDYVEVRSNRVLTVDDISDEFSSLEDLKPNYSVVAELDNTRRLNRFLIQTIVDSTDVYGKTVELNELVVLNDSNSVFNLKKGNISNNDVLVGDFYGDIDEISKEIYVRFDAQDLLNTNYNIKYLQSEYTGLSVGVGSTDIAFVKLLSSNTNIGIGTTTNILSLNKDTLTSFYGNFAVVCDTNNTMNYVEVYVTHDGNNSFLSELYFDSTNNESSTTPIGIFTSYVSGNLLKFDFYNTFTDGVKIIGRSVGFGSTSVGIDGVHRFKLSGQPSGAERTAIYKTNCTISTAGVTTATVLSFDKNLFSSIKATVQVGLGNTNTLHQVLLVHDKNNIFTTQYPFLSPNQPLGIGSFGGIFNGNDVILEFYPDSGITTSIKILSFSEQIYETTDEVNTPPKLDYGSVRDSVGIKRAFGLNSDELNVTQFETNYNGVPIFMKTIDPSDTTVFNLQTGVFKVTNHFFSTGEELIYQPTSTFLGVAATAFDIVSTLDWTGVSTTVLPSKVYAIKDNNDEFRIASRKQYADSGIAVTFTSIGGGNAHLFEMFKKNEKTIITLNNLVQYPLAYSDLAFTLTQNVGAGDTVFPLSGISSVNPKDLVRIDDEYLFVTNVGLGTSSIGPITFTGSFPLIEVKRGSVGTAATSHTSATTSRIYRGSYNIVKNKIHFTDPPRGAGFFVSDKDERNLTRDKASFSGRVFLRKNYATNQVYDSITEKFTGIGATFTLTAQGINTVGLGTTGGNGIVFINSIFQAPTTENNLNNNFAIIEVVAVAGFTSVIFSGITDTNGNLIISDFDINKNQLPRGGVIVSIGSTVGVGYAPLVGANVVARLSGLGTITSIETPPLVVSNKAADASRVILQNKRLIAEESVGIMLSAYPGFAVPGGNISCEDDIVNVLESVSHNLQYGANDLTYDAGLLYITNTYLSGEEDESIYAFQQARDLAILSMKNIGIGTSTSATIGITTTMITGINTSGLSIGKQVRSLPNLIQYDTKISSIGIGSIFINKVSLNSVAITTSIIISQYSTLPQYFDLTITGDVSGVAGVYNSNDCADISSSIGSLVGIVTNAIGLGTLPSTRTQVQQSGSFGSGYNGQVSVAITDPSHTGTAASITATVGAGGTLTFNVVSGGSGYVSPTIFVRPPCYDNVSVEGTFRVGIGTTTETGIGLLLDLEVGVSDRDPISVSNKAADAATLIKANKLLIAEEAVGETLQAFPGFSIPGGNQNCTDDIQLVLESLAFNLQFGGNNKVYDAGKIYIDNGYLAGEEEQSVFAYDKARDFAIDVMKNIGVGNSVSATIGITTTSITGIDTTGLTINKQVRSLPNVIQYDTKISSIGIGTIFIDKLSLNSVAITTSIIISEHSSLPQNFDLTITGDVSGVAGVYNSNDCADIASAIGSLVGIVTNAIGLGTLPQSKVGVAGSVFEISGFKIKRPGYGFRRGDKFRPVGLVTAKGLAEPLVPFELTVVDIYNDSFASWQFGELNYIDSIKNYQDGVRTRFPLFYKNQLLSFETNANDLDSQLIDFDALLVIFINGAIQEPKKAYTFDGGTSFVFNFPPKPEDNISVFFYLGTANEDSVSVNVVETIKPGDQVQIISSNTDLQNTVSQDKRTIIDIVASDKIETNLYLGNGIDASRLRPLAWTKQKSDLFINNTIIPKTRDSIETQIYPAARIIKDLSSSSSVLFVDNADFFNYEGKNPTEFGAVILDQYNDPVSAGITALVSIAGTIQSLIINQNGSGLSTSATIKISRPKRIGVGIGTSATASITIVNGSVTTAQITNSGFGYTYTAPPQVIVSLPKESIDFIKKAQLVNGYDGKIVGIATTTGIGVPLALKFTLSRDPLTFPTLTTGFPLYITDTRVGNGVTSVDTHDDSIIGIGTTCLDNIYYIHAFDSVTGIATCNIKSNTSVVGIVTTGTFNNPAGRFTWGRISAFTRSSSPISIGVTGKTVTSGLSTYPIIQRRDTGLRDTGGLTKSI